MIARKAGKPASALKGASDQLLRSLVTDVGAKGGRASSRSLVQEKLDWLDAIAADHERVNSTTFKIAYFVAQHLNSRTREAWPSQDRLAELAGVSETTLRAALKTLIGLGYLEQGKRGVRNANKYRPRIPPGGADAA